MPRNPAVKKGHNARHENGLVGPGKRVSKQKSNGQLGGNVKPSSTTDEPLPTPTNTTFAERESIGISSAIDAHANGEAVSSSEDLRWRKRGSESSSDFQEQRWDGHPPPTSRVMDAMQTRGRNVQELSALQIASTILTSNPAGDTIALLIVLLALPSLVLTIVQALFASLTLMPPTGGASPVSFLSLFDVFQGSAGSPSISTMAVVDVICFGLWMCLWSWAQNFALDLAQIQIAMTLGSGTSGKNGSVNSVCFFLVLLLHAARSPGLRRFARVKMVPASVLSHPRLTLLSSYLPHESTVSSGMSNPSKVQSLFAIHIISQALMAFVRRRIAGTSSSQRTRRLDSEAALSTTTALDSSAQDTLFNTAASPGSDQAPLPTPTIREARDRTLTAKKRRRQANQVRSRQPFWAALASTKVHVLREVEQKKEKPGVVGQSDVALKTDLSDSVFITGVEPSAIHFEACYLAPDPRQLNTSHNNKLLYVRINNARWHSVSLEPVDDDDDACGDPAMAKWTGSITGLAPDCNYVCSFRRVAGDVEIAAVMVRTPPLNDRDQGHAAMPPPTRQTARPNSPTTTLKTSIQTAERSREDANNRRNKLRRNHRNALAKLDREIETLQNKLKSASDDHKQKQKLLQFEHSAKQHEEAINALGLKLDDLETIPEEETLEYDQKKAAYDARNHGIAAANDSLNKVKAQTKKDLAVVSGELASTTARKDRLVARNTKLTAETERLTQANLQNMSERERKAVESATREQVQVSQTTDWKRRINDLDAQLNTLRLQTEKVFGEIEDAMGNAAGPLTPEGELPGTQGSRGLFFGSINASTFIPDPHASPFQSQAPHATTDGASRPRSGTNHSLGAMSAMSGDFDDADPIPPMPAHIDFDVSGLRERRGSGSSRGQNNHSPGILGGGLRSSQKRSHSPGQFGSTNTW